MRPSQVSSLANAAASSSIQSERRQGAPVDEDEDDGLAPIVAGCIRARLHSPDEVWSPLAPESTSAVRAAILERRSCTLRLNSRLICAPLRNSCLALREGREGEPEPARYGIGRVPARGHAAGTPPLACQLWKWVAEQQS